MEWTHLQTAHLTRTRLSAVLNLSQHLKEDDRVQANELGLEFAFFWRGRWRHELHRWPITRREGQGVASWEVGDELMPPCEFDE